MSTRSQKPFGFGMLHPHELNVHTPHNHSGFEHVLEIVDDKTLTDPFHSSNAVLWHEIVHGVLFEIEHEEPMYLRGSSLI